MDFELDEEWLPALGLGIVTAFVVLAMFKFGGVEVSRGIKIMGMLGGVVTGTLVSKFIFSR